jgi:selenocysteine lyase/cysteine desulfurase
LVLECENGLRALGLKPMCARDPQNSSGILAFQHPQTALLHKALEHEHIHVMHHAGRIRIAIHGYNTHADIANLLRVLETVARTV